MFSGTTQSPFQYWYIINIFLYYYLFVAFVIGLLDLCYFHQKNTVRLDHNIENSNNVWNKHRGYDCQQFI